MEPIHKEEIRDNKLFQNMDFETLSFQNVVGKPCLLNQGELLYRSGEISTSLFLVVRGEINLIPSQFSSAAGSVVFSENEFFGVKEFFSQMPRRESAIALRDTLLLEFTKEDVTELVEQSKTIMDNIKNALGQAEPSIEQQFSETQPPKIEDSSPVFEDSEIQLTIEEDSNKSFDESILQQIINEEKLARHNNDISDDETSEEEKPPKKEVLDIVTPPQDTSNEMTIKQLENTSNEMTFKQLEKINRAAHLVNSNVKIDDVLKNIVDVSVSLCSADRGTLYLVDRSNNELWSKVLQGGEPKRITLRIGDGFAGWSAETREIVNVEDASVDERFNDAFDKASGYTTKSVLCFPIKNRNDDVLGIIQLLNSNKGIFSKLDENFLSALSTHAAMALQNADLVEQLLTTERISSLGKMANFLIEDIRKPILVSKKYAEHLKKKELDFEIQNVIDMLLEQLSNIADFVQATSNYSHGKSVLKSNDVLINETLSDFLERVDPLVESMNCKVVTNFDSNAKINMDAKEFFQGFKHIIKNACDAMPDGGEIDISTKIENENINIIIKDNGLGIPAGFNEKIFEPFMSYGKKTGTGLGLSVTRKIIEEHGGTISATSNVGSGSTFTISLPIVN